MDSLARILPAVAFVFVGDHREQGRGLPGSCHFLGLKRQTDLPSHRAHVQVGVLPWKADEVTQATSSFEFYEHLAMGLPVVAPG